MLDPALTRPASLADLRSPEQRAAEQAAAHAGAEIAQLEFQLEAPDAERVFHGHLARVVAHSSDRVAWLRARSRGITATDVAKLSTPRSVQSAAYDKLHGTGFSGNVYTQHGRTREPEIAAWVAATHGIHPSDALYHSERDKRFLATPDGLTVRSSGSIELAEIKTTNKPFNSIPRNYLRQIWWQQYVLGAERTLFVWEQHAGFVPLHDEPQCLWVDRDENEIRKLVALACDLIDALRRATSPQPTSPQAS